MERLHKVLEKTNNAQIIIKRYCYAIFPLLLCILIDLK